MAVDPKLTDEAVTMMKTGVRPDVVLDRLVASGADGAEARALVDQLVTFKRQADALDPARLRHDATWMLWQGAPVEHVVQHFVSAGIAIEHAQREVERLAAEVRKMRPCDRCRRPVVASEAYFDAMGQQICRSCHSLVEIGNAERRVIEGALEAVGVPAFAIQAAGSVPHAYQPTPAAPYCSSCGVYSGVHVNAIHPANRAQLHPGWSFVCGRCGRGLR